MIRPQTKISKAQYRALLTRIMDSGDMESNHSQAMNMSNAMSGVMPYGAGMQPGMPPQLQQDPTSQDPMAMMQNTMQGQGQEQLQPEITPPNPSVMPTEASVQPAENLEQLAVETWKELQGTLGEQLWGRFTGGVNAAQSFIQAAVQFMKDPNSITDDRMKQFLSGVLPTEALSPQSVGTDSNPLMETIMNTMR